MFQLNASVIIRAKVKNSTKTPHFIVRYWGTCQWMSLEFKCQWKLAVLQYTSHHILWHYFTTPLFGFHSTSAQAQKNSPKHSVRACKAAILLVWSKFHKLAIMIHLLSYMVHLIG